MDEVERLRYRLSNLNDELRYEINRDTGELTRKIESLREEGASWEDLEDLRLELLQRQTWFMRVVARELRKLNGEKKKEGKQP